jgi:hypothetical protein
VWSSRDAESERRKEQRCLFFLGALRSGLSLGGCRNEFVGEENVPETANRSGCVHGPVGCWTSKSWVGLLYLSPG